MFIFYLFHFSMLIENVKTPIYIFQSIFIICLCGCLKNKIFPLIYTRLLPLKWHCGLWGTLVFYVAVAVAKGVTIAFVSAVTSQAKSKGFHLKWTRHLKFRYLLISFVHLPACVSESTWPYHLYTVFLTRAKRETLYERTFRYHSTSFVC